MKILSSFIPYPPAGAIFTGIGVLLSLSVIFGSFTLPFLTSDVLTGTRLRPFPMARVLLAEVFEWIENLFRRLETYI